MNENFDSDLRFRFPSSQEHNIPNLNLPCSSSHAVNAVNYDLNHRKKRPKLIKMDADQFPSCSRPKYTKKPNPDAPKITRPCSECGKKFWSWKALFGHMRCHPERQWRGINPPSDYRPHVVPKQTSSNREAMLMTKEDNDTAASLLMLANGTASSDERQWSRNYQPNDAYGTNSGDPKVMMVLGHKCSICLRVFSSGQALGGHMRCHSEKRDNDTSSPNQGLNLLSTREDCTSLDLNLLAPIQNDSSSSHSSDLALDLRLSL